MYAVNGYYLKGYEQKDTKPFEPLEMMVEKAGEVKDYIQKNLGNEEQERLREIAGFIQGFESPYGLELLATVDMLIEENQSFDTAIISQKLWSDRKKDMFPQKHVDLAILHLSNYRSKLYSGLRS
jgi:hypothetical protein